MPDLHTVSPERVANSPFPQPRKGGGWEEAYSIVAAVCPDTGDVIASEMHTMVNVAVGRMDEARIAFPHADICVWEHFRAGKVVLVRESEAADDMGTRIWAAAKGTVHSTESAWAVLSQLCGGL